jgi:hypothetical protein
MQHFNLCCYTFYVHALLWATAVSVLVGTVPIVGKGIATLLIVILTCDAVCCHVCVSGRGRQCQESAGLCGGSPESVSCLSGNAPLNSKIRSLQLTMHGCGNREKKYLQTAGYPKCCVCVCVCVESGRVQSGATFPKAARPRLKLKVVMVLNVKSRLKNATWHRMQYTSECHLAPRSVSAVF